MITEADRINARISDEAHKISRSRIDLDAFLALSSADRAARWRQWPTSAKQDAGGTISRRRRNSNIVVLCDSTPTGAVFRM